MAISRQILSRKKETIALSIFLLSSTSSYSIGLKTSTFCVADYLTYCSNYEIGSEELRQCFRLHGKQLSKSCVQALIEDGEISQAEVESEKVKKITIVEKVKNFFKKPKPKVLESTPKSVKVKTPDTSKGYPLFLEWSDKPEQMGNGISPYGIFDHK